MIKKKVIITTVASYGFTVDKNYLINKTNQFILIQISKSPLFIIIIFVHISLHF